jgi:hypothetical protein
MRSASSGLVPNGNDNEQPTTNFAGSVRAGWGSRQKAKLSALVICAGMRQSLQRNPASEIASLIEMTPEQQRQVRSVSAQQMTHVP